jgi:DNA-3-methyladenine glycosylase II
MSPRSTSESHSPELATSIITVRMLTNSHLAAAAKVLAVRDKSLASILEAYGPPPMWGRKPGFTTLVRIIIEQQVSLVSARAMFARLRTNIEPFAAERFIELGEPFLRSLGMTRQKSAYCVHLAQATAEGRLDSLAKLSDDEAHTLLLQIKGIGPWTAQVYQLMALRRPDIWPDGDVALAAAVMNLKKLTARPTFPELVLMAERWRPFRSVAARMLWQYYLAGK